jgi:mono/diheme cytochrome c family protein
LTPSRPNGKILGNKEQCSKCRNARNAQAAFWGGSREPAVPKRRSSADSSRRNFLKGAGLAGAAAAVAASAFPAAPSGDAGNGKRLYLADGCFTCHGRSGQGGAYNGPAPILAKTALPFDGFKAQLRNPVDDMPAYSDAILSDQDIADISAFVQSLPGRRPPKDIAILNN